jgi:uncharacterized MAPEG superfamily protein
MSSRGKIALAVALSLPVAGALWFGLRRALPPIAMDPMTFALGCIGAALLLTLLLGIEAVAHERLFTPAIDPLAGKDSSRLIVNQRFVQNTLEQSAVFAAGLLLLAHCQPDLRAVAATAITWVVGRWAFWVGYHVGPMWRGLGYSRCSRAWSSSPMASAASGSSSAAGPASQPCSARSRRSRPISSSG